MSNKNRDKGHAAERHYAKEFRGMGFSFCKTSRYGSRLLDDCKIDLMNLPFNVQIKAGYAKGLNYTTVLRSIKDALKINFPEKAEEHGLPSIIIHKKDVGRGRKRDDYDELVTMSFNDFKTLINKIEEF